MSSFQGQDITFCSPLEWSRIFFFFFFQTSCAQYSSESAGIFWGGLLLEHFLPLCRPLIRPIHHNWPCGSQTLKDLAFFFLFFFFFLSHCAFVWRTQWALLIQGVYRMNWSISRCDCFSVSSKYWETSPCSRCPTYKQKAWGADKPCQTRFRRQN